MSILNTYLYCNCIFSCWFSVNKLRKTMFVLKNLIVCSRMGLIRFKGREGKNPQIYDVRNLNLWNYKTTYLVPSTIFLLTPYYTPRCVPQYGLVNTKVLNCVGLLYLLSQDNQVSSKKKNDTLGRRCPLS